MLEIQNNIKNKSFKKKNVKDKSFYSIRNNLAAKYLSDRFIKYYNLKNPENKISDHLIKIFSYFLNYKVQNIDLIRLSYKEKEEVLEFKVNFFNNSYNSSTKNNVKVNEVISIKSFFNNNFKYLII